MRHNAKMTIGGIDYTGASLREQCAAMDRLREREARKQIERELAEIERAATAGEYCPEGEVRQ